jgi:hypothetical protein
MGYAPLLRSVRLETLSFPQVTAAKRTCVFSLVDFKLRAPFVFGVRPCHCDICDWGVVPPTWRHWCWVCGLMSLSAVEMSNHRQSRPGSWLSATLLGPRPLCRGHKPPWLPVEPQAQQEDVGWGPIGLSATFSFFLRYWGLNSGPGTC